jgi:hypothetical protein
MAARLEGVSASMSDPQRTSSRVEGLADAWAEAILDRRARRDEPIAA